MVLRLLRSIFSDTPQETSKFDEAVIQSAIERVIDSTDPRLRAVPHYRRKLRTPVIQSLEYAMALVDSLPSAIELNSHNFMTIPELRAAFTSADHMREVLSFGPHMRDYRQKTTAPLVAELFAAIGMERIEKNTFGVAMHGDMLRRDVAQTTISFCNHRLVFPATSEQQTRRKLVNQAFDSLVESALENLVTTRHRRQQLERQQRQLLQNKAGLLRSAGLGLETLKDSPTPTPNNPKTIARRLREIESELTKIRTHSATIEQHLAHVATTLKEPEKYLRLERVSLQLNHMNVKVSSNSPKAGNILHLNDVIIGKNQQHLTAMLIRFHTRELLPQPDFFAQARRMVTPRLT